jgi:hypothetical protein
MENERTEREVRDYQLQEGETEAKQLHPAKSSAEQLAAWCGGVVARGGMADASLTLPDGMVAKAGDWIVRKADGSVRVQTGEPLEGYPVPEAQVEETEETEPGYAREPAVASEPAPDPQVGQTYYDQQRQQ